MLKKTLVILVITLALVSGSLFAQQSNSRITGKITDEDGNALPGVAVTATSPKLVGKAETISDENGVYRLLNLAPGVYKIVYVLEGFQTISRTGLQITLEQTLKLDVQMKLGNIEEKITVTGEAPLIDVKDTSKGMTLTKEVFSSLPKGRNFDSLLTAIPGVAQEDDWLGGTSVDGASGAENMYYIDGVNTNDLYSGQNAQGAAFEFVDEVQVKASGYQAEFGGSLGGVINVVTRSGGNEFSGEVMAYYSGSALNGKERDTLRLNPEDTSVAEYVNYQDLYGKDKTNRIEAGFAVGGYIIKDKVWFFGSFLPVFRSTTRTVKWLYGSEEDYDQKQTWWNFSGKLTAQPVKDMRVSASFTNNFYKWRGDLPGRAGTGNPDKTWGDYGFDFPGWNVAASLDYTVGNNLMISARGGYFFTNTTNQQVGPTGPRWAFWEEAQYYDTTNIGLLDVPESYWQGAGYTNYGYYDGYETEKDKRMRASFNLDVNYFVNLAGEHSWKAGIQWVRIEQDVADVYKYPYVMFGWGTGIDLYQDGNYKTGKYGYYAVRGGVSSPFGTSANPNSTRWAAYLQDSWTIGQKLTLNLGVRIEKEDIPSFSDLPEYSYPPIEFGFGDKIAPRLGFVYDLKGDSSTKIFGSFGIFYDVMKLEMASGSYGGFKWISDYYTLDTYEWNTIGVDGYFPGEYIGNYNFRMPSFDTTDPEIKPMAQREVSFGMEQKLTENISMSVRVVNKHLIRTIEDVGVLVPGEGEQYFVANPGYGWTLTEANGGKFDSAFPDTPKAKREYWGVNIAVDKRFSNNWMGGFSYTWSSLKGNYSGLVSSDEYGRVSPNVNRFYDTWFLAFNQNMEAIDGPLASDRPHFFKVYGSYTFPFGLTVGTVVNAFSGVPVTKELAINYYQGYFPLGRATDGRTPFNFVANIYAEYNMKLGKKTRLQINLNVDNLLDDDTAQRVYSIINSGTIYVSEAQMLAGFDYRNYEYTAEPRFGKEMWFRGPISARLGLKLFF